MGSQVSILFIDNFLGLIVGLVRKCILFSTVSKVYCMKMLGKIQGLSHGY